MIIQLGGNRYSVDIADEPDIDVILDTQANDYIDARDAAKRLNELEAENKRLREALERARGHVVLACAQTLGIEYMTFVHMITTNPNSKPRILEQIDAALSTAPSAGEPDARG
jgi:hypothetical protein